jgi:hypothetical protein
MDPTTPTPAQDQQRFLKEAVAIAEGKSRLLPQREHVQVLASQMESVLKNVQTLGEVIAALMSVAGGDRLPIRAELLWKIRAQQSSVVLETTPDGSLIVHLRQSKPEPMAEPPTTKARVM